MNRRRLVFRQFLKRYVPLALVIGALALWTITVRESAFRKHLEAREANQLAVTAKLLTAEVATPVTDVLFLADISGRHLNLPGPIKSDVAMQQVEEDFLAFSRERKVYDQIRLIGPDGVEMIRVNMAPGGPVRVPKDQLQNKAARSYFKHTIGTNRGDVYISAFDLNIEHGQIELPPKPMLRFAAPVLDTVGHPLGIVVLNYNGRVLLERLVEITRMPGRRFYFLNHDGYFMIGPHSEDEWGFMFSQRAQKTFAGMFAEAAARVTTSEKGHIYTAKGLFTFQTVKLIRALYHLTDVRAQSEKDTVWKLVTHLPPSSLVAESRWPLVKATCLMWGLLAFMVWMWVFTKTRRQALETELADAEEKVLAIGASSVDPIIMIDDQDRVCFWNAAAKTMFGYSREEIMGQRLHSLIAPAEVAAEAEKGLNRFAQSGKGRVLGKLNEFAALRKDGTRFPVELAVSRTRIKDRWWAVASVRDMTDRNRITEELKTARQAAEQASRAKSAFLAAISHEIKTPLHAILGILELVQQTDLPTKIKSYVSKIRVASQGLTQVIDDILDVSKIEAGRLELDAVPFRLKDVLGRVADVILPLARDKEIAVEIGLPETLPATLSGDPVRLAQVLINLAGNAVKFTDKGSVSVMVGAIEDMAANAAESKSICLEFTITDTGIGIHEDQLTGIFEAFSQADGSISRKYGGTGLGLAICKHIVDLMGGHIRVQSRPGHGSSFSFSATFPIVDDEVVTADTGDAAQLDDLFCRLESDHLPGLDLVLGLENANNDKRIYLHLLKQFTAEFAGAADDLRGFLNNDLYIDATELTRAVKAAAGHIGAAGLKAHAEELHLSLKKGRPPDEIGFLDSFMVEFKRVMDTIDQLQEAPKDLPLSELPHRHDLLKARLLLSELQTQLGEGQFEAADTAAQLAELLNCSRFFKDFKSLEHRISRFEYGLALEMLPGLSSQVDAQLAKE